MDRPLFLIGAARSGTTVIAQLLAEHPDVAFWNEPKYVWRHGNHGARDDRRTAAEASPEVAGYVRRRFERFLASSGRSRFLEKTPSNCFRVSFVHAIFPDGLYLHLQRDGRDAAASALKRWCSAPDDGAILRRLRGFEIPLTALHHYAPDIAYELLLRRLRPQRGYLWGPRYPGIHQDIRAGRPVEELCALQWAHSARTAAAEAAQIPQARRLSLRYEELVRNPGPELQKILAFAGLPPSAELAAAAQRLLSAGRAGSYASLEPEQRRAIDAICLPVMRELGMAV